MIHQVKVEVPEAGFYQPLKGGRGIGQPNGHSIALVESQCPHSKCGQWFALLVHLDLPVSRLQVKQRDPLGLLQAVDGLIDVG